MWPALVVAALAFVAPAARPVRLSQPPDPARRALWPRRRCRRRHAHHGGEAFDPAQAERRDREPARRRRHRRRQGGRDQRRRRLQRADDRQQQRHRRGLFKSLPYDILKDFASTSTVSFFDLLIIVKDGSPLKIPAGHRQGRQGQSRQAQHRHHQSRQHAEPRRRAVQERHRHQGADRAVPHLRRHGDCAAARRPRRDVRVLHRRSRAAVRQEDRGAGLDRAQAQRLSARRADRDRAGLQGLRGGELERARRFRPARRRP